MKRLTVRLNHALCPLTEVITVVTKRAIFANLKKQFNVKTFKPQTYGSIKTHESPKLHYQKKIKKNLVSALYLISLVVFHFTGQNFISCFCTYKNKKIALFLYQHNFTCVCVQYVPI